MKFPYHVLQMSIDLKMAQSILEGLEERDKLVDLEELE